MPPMRVRGELTPRGDQAQAIERLAAGLRAGAPAQVLLGVTGSGKTYTMAKAIEAVDRPALILAHNKTLAGQLYTEFRELFNDNAVGYFISYYDYYQPEAYIPASDTFIEKDSSINDAIDRMRHEATRFLLERRDVIIVASVSCIFGIGEPESYGGMRIELALGQTIDRGALLTRLVEAQYERNDFDLYRGSVRVRGDVIEVFPAHEREQVLRIELFGDTIDGLAEVDPLRGQVLRRLERAVLYPSSHYVIDDQRRRQAIASIREELRERLTALEAGGKLVERQRLEQRTLADLEALETQGFCPGIENYSRHLTGRPAGAPPPTLLDYFPEDFVLFVDESHQTIPQVRGMYNGDRSRKLTLVEYGFRLPSALDNRPLDFAEFNARVRQVVYVSATPGDYELQQAGPAVAEQLIRPTGLLDPRLELRPVEGQVEDLLAEIRARVAAGQRVLVTTLTKRMAEDLAEYYGEVGLKVAYLHSDIETLERARILDDLRRGTYDVLVGINLLREGLDLPEVSLVAILDADKEGFLRAERSLIQIIGRAARHVDGTVLLYASRLTDSLRRAMSETERRRRLQATYNAEHGITPVSIAKAIRALAPQEAAPDGDGEPGAAIRLEDPDATRELVAALRAEMLAAARALEFERAAGLRDRIAQLEDALTGAAVLRRITRPGPRDKQRRGRRPR